jgi:arylsulfatase A-like enzyme
MKKKNLLYIFADQWRYHAIGATGEDKVVTPNFDKFANDSIKFTNAISTYPLCSPHRAALQTGKYPLSCGFWTNCKTGLFISPTLSPKEITITDTLKANGYDTAYIGKWHLDSSDLNYYKNPKSNATNWDAFTPSGERRHNIDFWYSYGAMDNHLHPHYWKDSSKMISPGNVWSPKHETDVLLNYFENRDRENPFCTFLSWNPPHPPYDKVPDKYKKYYSRKTPYRNNVPEYLKSEDEYNATREEYFAAVTGIDEQFGRIYKYLEDNNLVENTIIVLSADHGDCMGSHNLFGKNVWYEESIKIPLYIKDPSLKDLDGTEVDNLIESCDHMPLLLDLLNVKIPSTVEGVSVKKNLTKEFNEEKKYAFLCMLPGMPNLVEPFKKAGLDSMCFGFRGIRAKNFTYIIDNGTKPNFSQKRYYYDLGKDPYQMNPKELNKQDKICEKLDPILKDWSSKQKDSFLYDR